MPQPEAELTAQPKLPTLRGTPRSTFDFRVTTKNDSAQDMLVTLAAQALRGFQVVFKEGYGTQELTSIPIKAGESNNLAVEVKPPLTIAAGQHPVVVHLSSENPIAVETARMSLAMIVLGVAANTEPAAPAALTALAVEVFWP